MAFRNGGRWERQTLPASEQAKSPNLFHDALVSGVDGLVGQLARLALAESWFSDRRMELMNGNNEEKMYISGLGL